MFSRKQDSFILAQVASIKIDLLELKIREAIDAVDHVVVCRLINQLSLFMMMLMLLETSIITRTAILTVLE